MYDTGMAFVTAMPENTWMAALDLDEKQESPYLDPEGKVDPRSGLKIQRGQLTLEEYEHELKTRLHPDIFIEKLIWHSHYRVNERLSSRYW